MYKKYNPGFAINFNSTNDSSNKIKKIKLNKYNLYYYNDKWQLPVKTEKNVFDIYFRNKDLPTNYFAFPWATLIDEYTFNKNKDLIEVISQFKIKDSECFTVCQHISFKRIIPVLEKIGITHLFTPHKSKLDNMFIKTNIVIIPFVLYPVNQNIELENFYNCKYLYSFVGSYNKYYLTDIRNKIKNLKKTNRNLINVKSEWFFHKHVYENQLKNNNYENILENEDLNFQNILKNSKFSLCPSGTGVNSIRIFEALSFGSIPVILSDNIILPSFLLKANCLLLFKENNIDKIDTLLNNISLEEVNLMKKNCLNFYKNFIRGDNFVKLINKFFTS